MLKLTKFLQFHLTNKRHSIDFIAYAKCLNEGISNSLLSECVDEVKQALNNLDLIVFIPLTSQHTVDYVDDNPRYRQLADRYFKQIYRDGIYDLFPTYNHPPDNRNMG